MRVDTIKTSNVGVRRDNAKRESEVVIRATLELPDGVSLRLRGKSKEMKRTYWALQTYNRAHKIGCKVQFIKGIVYITKPTKTIRRKEDNDNEKNTTENKSLATKVSELPCFSTTNK